MRAWVDDRKKNPVDKRWVMRCDGAPGGLECSTVSEPFPGQPDLEVFRDRGWFIAELNGDLCPGCLALGLGAGVTPHRVMGELGTGLEAQPMVTMTRDARPNADPAPPRRQHNPTGLTGSGVTVLEELAQDLKRAEARHTSLEHSMLYHRELAADLIQEGYVKIPEGSDVTALAERAGVSEAAANTILAALLAPSHAAEGSNA